MDYGTTIDGYRWNVMLHDVEVEPSEVEAYEVVDAVFCALWDAHPTRRDDPSMHEAAEVLADAIIRNS